MTETRVYDPIETYPTDAGPDPDPQPLATMAECQAAEAHILAAPRDNALIETLCFRPDYGQRHFPDELELTVDRGILGERWEKAAWLRLPDGAPDPRIQVSILQRRVLDLCWRNRATTPHPGDTMIVDMNLGEENMPEGQRLAAGTAVLEVSTKFNNACPKWKARNGVQSLAWLNRRENLQHRFRGVLCKIVEDGVVRRGDVLRKL
ncbi:MAG: hypothetical protein AAF761_07160 [Pseudomonadota bacterium]